jgi:alcohol dehydrogenase
LFDGVKPDPTYSIVQEGTDMAIREKCDSILAFGGGSSIDAAKVISLAVNNSLPIRKLKGIGKAKKKGLPLFAVPTTAGTGSEATLGAVITDDTTHEKTIVADKKTAPIAAAIDSVLLSGAPPALAAASGMDALSHAVEAYVGSSKNKQSKEYAEKAVLLIFTHLPRVISDTGTLKDWDALGMASYYGGIAIQGAGAGYVHAIAHQIGAKCGIAHGIINSVLMPRVLRHYVESGNTKCIRRLARLARLIQISGTNDLSLAEGFIEAIEGLSNQLNINSFLKNIKTEDIPQMAFGALSEGNFTYFEPQYISRKSCEELIHQTRLQ